MDKYFFALKNNQKIGPLNIAQLKELKLLSNDLVWCSDFGDDWKKVDEIEEFKTVYIKSPPPTPTERTQSIIRKEIKTILIFFFSLFLIIGVLSFGALYDWLLYSVNHRYKNDSSDVFLYSFVFISLPISLIITALKHQSILKKIFNE